MDNTHFNMLINKKDWMAALKCAGNTKLFVSAYVSNNNYACFNEMITYFIISYNNTRFVTNVVNTFRKMNIDENYIKTAIQFIQLYRILGIHTLYNNNKARNKNWNRKLVIPSALIKGIIENGNSAILADIVNLCGDDLDATYKSTNITDGLACALKDVGFSVVCKNGDSQRSKIIKKLVLLDKYKRRAYLTKYCTKYRKIENNCIYNPKGLVKIEKFFDEYIESIKSVNNRDDLVKELCNISIKHTMSCIINKLIGHTHIKPSSINTFTKRYITRIKNLYSYGEYILRDVYTMVTSLHAHKIEYNKHTMGKLVCCCGNYRSDAVKLAELYLLVDMRNYGSFHIEATLYDLIRSNNIDMIKRLIDNKIIMISRLHETTDFMDNAICSLAVDVVNYFHSMRVRCRSDVASNLYRIHGKNRNISLDRLKLVESIGFPIDQTVLIQLCKCNYDITNCVDYIIDKYKLNPSTECMSHLINNTRNYFKYKKYVSDINKKSYPIKMISKYADSRRICIHKHMAAHGIPYLKLIVKISKINNTDTNTVLCKMINTHNIKGIIELIETTNNYDRIKIMDYIVDRKYGITFFGMELQYILCRIITEEWSYDVQKYFTDRHNIICEYIASSHSVWYEPQYKTWDKSLKESFDEIANDDEFLMPHNIAKIRALNIIKKISTKNGKQIDMCHLVCDIFYSIPLCQLIQIPHNKSIRDIISNSIYYKLVDVEINSIDNISVKEDRINNILQNDSIFVLYKVYTDTTYIKYKQVAFNTLIFILTSYDRIHRSIWQTKNIINEINNLYDMGAVPSPYTWVIATFHAMRYNNSTTREFLINLLTKHNKVFDSPADSFMNIRKTNIPVEIVEYNHPPGFFDEYEINRHIYYGIRWNLPGVENELLGDHGNDTSEDTDELDILANDAERDILSE